MAFNMNSVKKQLVRQAQRAGEFLVSKIKPRELDEALTIKNFRALYERCPLSSFLTYRFAEEEGIWLADNSEGMDGYLMGYEIAPVIVAGEKVQGAVEKILALLPVGAVIHSIAHASADIAEFLEQWAMSRRSSDNPIFDMITKRRAEYLLNWSRDQNRKMGGFDFSPRKTRYYIFIRIPGPNADMTPEREAEFRHTNKELASQIESTLDAVNLYARRLSGEQCIRTIRSIANLHVDAIDERENVPSTEFPVPQQIFDAETVVDVKGNGDISIKNNINGNHRLMRFLTVNVFPKDPLFLSQISTLLGDTMDPSSFIAGDFYTYSVMERLDPEKVKNQCAWMMGKLQHQTKPSSDWWREVMSHLYERRSNVENLYRSLENEGVIPVKAYTGIVISAEDKKELDTRTSIVRNLWERIGLKLHQETTISVPMWLASLPGQFRHEMDGDTYGLQRGTSMRACNAATLTHLQGDWQGSPPNSGGLLLLSRRGVLTNINLFDVFKSNYNGVMAASSGGGKSFLMNEICSDFLARGGKVRIIDAGRSYFNTAEVLGGQNLVFEREKGMCINPFSHINTQEEMDEQMETLVSLVAQMAFPFGFGKEQRDKEGQPYAYRSIENIITAVWRRRGGQMTIRDLADFCAQADDPRIRDINIQLQPWAYGRYSPWMVGENNVEFDNNFLVLELDDLAEEPELQGVVLNLVITKIMREMYLDSKHEVAKHGRKLPKLVIIDEAWDLLKRPNTGDFIEKGYRRARKYEGSFFIITQSFMDCEQTSGARVAIENSNWMFALMQDINAVQKAVEQKLISLSDEAIHSIANLQKTNEYSELFVVNKSLKGEGLYRLVVDPATYWTYTTHAQERAKLDELTAEGKSVVEAIDILSSKQKDKEMIQLVPQAA